MAGQGAGCLRSAWGDCEFMVCNASENTLPPLTELHNIPPGTQFFLQGLHAGGQPPLNQRRPRPGRPHDPAAGQPGRHAQLGREHRT